MSALAVHSPAERRRANFFRDTQRDHAPIASHDGSYHYLRAELGDENTNRLIANIGTLALSSGIETSGVSLSDAVKRIIGSLTPAERSAIASGAAPPPRVQALLDSELKQAQQQRQAQLAATKSDAPSSDAGEHGVRPFMGGVFARGGYGGRGDYGSFGASSSTYVSNPSSVTMLNYAGSPYAATGMTYSTFAYLRNDLRAENFSGQNILHAGQDARRHGFNANDRPVARDFAIIDRDDGARRAEMSRIYSAFDRALANDAEIQRLKKERDQAQTSEAKRAIEQQLRERAQHLSGKAGMAEHIRTAPTDAARAAHERNRNRFIQRHTGLQLEHQASIGDDAARQPANAQTGATMARVAPSAQIAPTVRSAELRTNASLDADLLAAANPTAPRRDAGITPAAPETNVAVATTNPTATPASDEKKPDVKPVQTATGKPATGGPQLG